MQGNNEANRTNRRALNDLLVAFAKQTDAASSELEQQAASFTKVAQIALPVMLGVTLLGSLLTAIFFAQRSLTKPILDLSGVMETLTRGDIKVVVPHVDRQDEIGTMAKAVAVLRENSEQVALLQQQEKAAAAARLARAQSMEAVVNDVGDVVPRPRRETSRRGSGSTMRTSRSRSSWPHQRDQCGRRRRHQRVLGCAEGDRGRRPHPSSRHALPGPLRDLKDAINETVERLSTTVKTIQATSEDVRQAAREISMGAGDLSKRTEEQASSLEETAATTEELAASVKATAQTSLGRPPWPTRR